MRHTQLFTIYFFDSEILNKIDLCLRLNTIVAYDRQIIKILD